MVSAVAVLSLTLAIGANTAIFSLVNAVMLRALLVHRADRLVWITPLDREGQDAYLSLAAMRQLEQQQQVFSNMFTWEGGGLTDFETSHASWRASLDVVSGNYFSVLGVKPVIGRLINTGDARLDAGPPAPVAVLSYSCWRARFGGDPSIVGEEIRVAGVPLTIIGVAQPGFFGLILDWKFDVAAPFGYSTKAHADSRQVWLPKVVGRLKDGVTIRQAREQITAMWPSVRNATLPDNYHAEQKATYLAQNIAVSPAATGISYQGDRFRRALVALMILVASILLIACVNLAGLMIARAAARYHDSGVRIALGASIWRIVRHGLVESALLAIIGAGLGLVVAYWASHRIAGMVWRVEMGTTVSPDMTVLAFTATIAILSTMVSGLAPALRSARTNPAVMLQQGSRIMGAGPSRLSRVLMIAQIALSFMLVVSAGLFVRSLENLRTVDAGFRRDHILTAQLFPKSTVRPTTDPWPYFRELCEGIGRLPGVRAVSLSHMGPVLEYEYKELVSRKSGVDRSAAAVRDWVGPGFFHLMGMRVLAGREFDWSDKRGSPRVAVISESLAKFLFPSGDALGQSIRIGIGAEDQDREIVGVVNSASLWLIRSHEPMAVYVPLAQSSQLSYLSSLVDVWTKGDATRSIGPVRREIEAKGQQVVLESESLTSRIDWVLTNDRLMAWFASFLGILAMLLTGIGLYGLMSYHVTRRAGEMGIRMVVGASPRSMLWLVLRDVSALALMGLTAGVLGTLAVARIAAAVLFGLSGTDPFVLAGSAAALFAITLVGGYLPARRVARMDPMTALRAK
jgi:predicted permease